jgi:hypothetical protein
MVKMSKKQKCRKTMYENSKEGDIVSVMMKIFYSVLEIQQL